MTDRVIAPKGDYKPRIMAYLMDHRKGKKVERYPATVETDVDAMRMAKDLGLPAHDLIHVLHSLQKQDAIHFRARTRATTGKRGPFVQAGRGNLDQFQITATGAALAKSYVNGTHREDLMRDLPPGTLPGQAVYSGVTDADIDVSDVAEDLRREAPRTVIEKVIRDGAERRAQDAEPAEPASFVEHVLGRPLPAVSPPTPVITRPALSPILTAVLARHAAYAKIRDAATALEAVGLEDAALTLMGSDTETDIERAIAEHLLATGYTA